MTFSATVFKVLIASPSDLSEERDAAETAIHEWNASNSEADHVVLLPVRWETHVFPEANVRPQASINRQIVDGSDILIGMFWTRVGTNTGVATSGTAEEIDRFSAGNKPVMLYFSERPVAPSAINVQQFEQLRDLQSSTYDRALVGSFTSLQEFGHTLFKNLTALVRDLLSKSNKADAGQLAVAAPPNETNEVDDYFKPRPEWDVKRYERAFLFASHGEDSAVTDLIDEQFAASPLARAADALVNWEAWKEYARLASGKGGAVERLRDLSGRHPANASVRLVYASAMAQYDKDAAARIFREAASIASDGPELYRAVRRSLALEGELEKISETDTLLALMDRMPMPEANKQAAALEAYEALAKARGLNDVALTLTELASSVKPEDVELRFQLARQLGDRGRSELARMHYEAIPAVERSGAAWNNLGVALSSIEMPGEAVAAYKRAAELNETVASSNLANKLREAGFFPEAQDRLDAAMQVPDYEPNVVVSLEALREARANEAEKGKAAFRSARLEQAFRETVGRAAVAPSKIDLDGVWDIGACNITLRHDGGGVYLGEGNFKRDGGLGNALMGINTRHSGIVDVRVTLRRLGDGFEGEISRSEKDYVPSLLGDIFLQQPLLGYVETEDELKVWEVHADLPAKVWRRVQQNDGLRALTGQA